MRVRLTARVLMIFSRALRARISSRSRGAAARCSTLAAHARYSSRRRTVACIRRIARPTIAQSRRAALPRANASAFMMAARCTLYRDTQALRRAAAWIAVAARIDAASSRRHGGARGRPNRRGGRSLPRTPGPPCRGAVVRVGAHGGCDGQRVWRRAACR